jgi:hypothetical protein
MQDQECTIETEITESKFSKSENSTTPTLTRRAKEKESKRKRKERLDSKYIMPGPSNSVKLSNWAAMIAVTGAFILWAGAIAATYYPNKSPAIYGFIVGALVVAFYWPFKFLKCLLYPVSYNLVNVVLMIGFSIYCFFSQPTTMAGITFIASALVFVVAIIAGEKTNNLAGNKV